VQTYRASQRQGHQKFGHSLEHKKTIRLTRSTSNRLLRKRSQENHTDRVRGGRTFGLSWDRE
jgi:hypothetical protein